MTTPIGTTLITPGEVHSIGPDSIALNAVDALSSALIHSVATISGTTNLHDRGVLRVPFTDAGAEVGFVNEGATIPETATNIREVSVPTRKLAAIKVASREALISSDSGQLSTSLLTNQLLADINAQADRVIFGPYFDDRGLTSLTVNEDVTELGALGKNLDWLADAVANVVSGGGREDDIVIVTTPGAYAQLSKLKTQDGGNAPLVSTVAQDYAVPASNVSQMDAGTIQARRIGGIPIFQTRHMIDKGNPTKQDILIFDRANLLVAASPLEMIQSSEYAYERDSIAFRGSLRIGWKLARPERVSRVEVTIP